MKLQQAFIKSQNDNMELRTRLLQESYSEGAERSFRTITATRPLKP